MSLSSKNRNTVAILIIAAASLALYFNTLHNGFVWDDADQVKCNVWIRSIKFIPTILTVNTWGFMNGNTNYYRPGMHLGYMLVYHLFGPGPMGFHLLNIVFNAGVSVMVFLLALEVFETGGISSRRAFGVAFFSALLFTAHPAHTEAVAWIASFPELSYTLFYLLSLYFFILWRKGEVKEGISLSCLFFVLSFMCKETALSLPLAIAAYEIAFPAKDGRTGKTASWPFRVKIMLPYLALATAYFVLRLRIIGGFVKPMKYALHLTVFQWILNAIGNFSMYLGQLLYPFRLNGYHVFHPAYSIFGWRSILAIGVLLAFLAFAFLAYRKNRRVFFSLLMIIIPLLPALYLPVFQPEYNYAERYLYLPSIGFVFMAAQIFYAEKVQKFRLAAIAFAFLIIAAYSIKTVNRNTVWESNATFWADTVKKSPDGWLPNNQMGIVLEEKGEFGGAINYFKTAMHLAPGLAEPAVNLGSVYLKQGKANKAAELSIKAIKAEPLLNKAHLILGIAFAKSGLYEKAQKEFAVGIALNPMDWQAYYDMGLLYYEKKMYGPALREFSIALYINPYPASTHKYTGFVYMAQGELDKAIWQFETTVRLDPSGPDNYIALGNAYLKKGLPDRAAATYRAALKIDPANSEALKDLKALSAKK